MTVVLVTGGRNYDDRAQVNNALAELGEIAVIIEGGARGADWLAREWALTHGIHCATVPALWDFHGKAAGPYRNRAMLALRPDVVLAFPGGRGTSDMKAAARREGILVKEYGHPEANI